MTVRSLFWSLGSELIGIELIGELRESAWSGFERTSEEVNGPLAFIITKRTLARGPPSEDEYFAACVDRQIGHRFLLRNVFDDKMTENSVRGHVGLGVQSIQ